MFVHHGDECSCDCRVAESAPHSVHLFGVAFDADGEDEDEDEDEDDDSDGEGASDADELAMEATRRRQPASRSRG